MDVEYRGDIPLILIADDAAIVEAILLMALTLKLKVTAEGVEKREQLDFLVARKCDDLQGFHLAEAVTASGITDALKGALPIGIAAPAALPATPV